MLSCSLLELGGIRGSEPYVLLHSKKFIDSRIGRNSGNETVHSRMESGDFRGTERYCHYCYSSEFAEGYPGIYVRTYVLSLPRVRT